MTYSHISEQLTPCDHPLMLSASIVCFDLQMSFSFHSLITIRLIDCQIDWLLLLCRV